MSMVSCNVFSQLTDNQKSKIRADIYKADEIVEGIFSKKEYPLIKGACYRTIYEFTQNNSFGNTNLPGKLKIFTESGMIKVNSYVHSSLDHNIVLGQKVIALLRKIDFEKLEINKKAGIYNIINADRDDPFQYEIIDLIYVTEDILNVADESLYKGDLYDFIKKTRSK